MSVVYGVSLAACLALAVMFIAVQCRSRKWLVAFMLFLSAYMSLILLDSFNIRISPQAYLMSLAILFLPGPLILGYVSHISTRKEVQLKDFTFCFLPVVTALLCSDLLGGYPMFSLVPRDAYKMDSYIMIFNMISAMAGIHLLMYLARASHLILKMKKDWNSYQSKTLPDSWYDMIKVLLVIFVANATQVLSAFLFPTGNKVSVGDIGFMILVTHFVYLSVRTTFRAIRVDNDADDIIYEQTSYFSKVLDEEQLAYHADAQRIEKEVLEGQLFLREDLSLSSLAQAVSVSPHRLSAILNNCYEKNFYEYVNDLRVAYAANQMIQEPNKSVTEIFYSAGFSSKTTFYGYFKKTYQVTPSEFRKRTQQTPDFQPAEPNVATADVVDINKQVVR
ncbi:MAG: helix-turn-helix domain-containing protein [Reinekea sp.]|nr:helix-turn-helix domain-containing protein [Reinekea sp.]